MPWGLIVHNSDGSQIQLWEEWVLQDNFRLLLFVLLLRLFVPVRKRNIDLWQLWVEGEMLFISHPRRLFALLVLRWHGLNTTSFRIVLWLVFINWLYKTSIGALSFELHVGGHFDRLVDLVFIANNFVVFIHWVLVQEGFVNVKFGLLGLAYYGILV